MAIRSKASGAAFVCCISALALVSGPTTANAAAVASTTTADTTVCQVIETPAEREIYDDASMTPGGLTVLRPAMAIAA